MVGSDNRKRYEWPLGKIVELIPGNDGKVWVLKVKTSKGRYVKITHSGMLSVPEYSPISSM